jgi:hypothetical protein
MGVKTYEIVKQYMFDVNGLDYKVKGRIWRNLDPNAEQHPFGWQISHHCKPSESAGGVYYPSAVSARTLEEAEMLLFAYAKSFTNIGVKPNEDF